MLRYKFEERDGPDDSRRKDGNNYSIYEHKEDWSKIIHLFDNKFFVVGGSHERVIEEQILNQRAYRVHQIYSKKAIIVDT